MFDKLFTSLSGGGSDDDAEGGWKKEQMTADEQKLCGYIKQKVEDVRASASRISSEGIWMTNIAYLLGYDSIYYDTKLRSFRPINNTSAYLKRNRIHINKILPTCQNRLARLCKNAPKYDVKPESSSQEDKDQARFDLEVLQQLWDQENIELNKQRIELTQWTQQCGHAFLKTSWDDCLGQEMTDPETGEFIGYEGDIRVDVCSPFEIFVDPLAKRLEDAQWLVQAKVRKLDYFVNHYPERGGEVKEEGAWLLSTQYEQRINSLNTSGPMSSGTNVQMQHAAIELSYYEKRSKNHPKGRHVVCANGVLLKDDELAIGEIPFAKFDDVLIAGKFYSEAIITHLRPLQDQFNRIYNLRTAWANRLLKGKYIAAKGHGVSQESINDADTEVIQYDVVPGANEPHAVESPSIPSYIYQEEANLEKQFDQIASISEVSKGQLPSASIPAIGMQLLQEQDETRIGITTEYSENGYARVGRHLLKTANRQYQTQRKLKKAGKLGEYEIKDFVGAKISANPDVTVIRGSTIPNSKALRRQELFNLYTQGLLGDPADPKVRASFLDKLEYGDIGEVWLDQSLDMAQIKKTIAEIEQGIPPQVSEFDNNELHIQEKNRYRKSDKFDLLPPENQELFMQDMNARLDMVVEQNNPPAALEEPNVKDEVAANGAASEAAHTDNLNNQSGGFNPIEQVPEA